MKLTRSRAGHGPARPREDLSSPAGHRVLARAGSSPRGPGRSAFSSRRERRCRDAPVGAVAVIARMKILGRGDSPSGRGGSSLHREVACVLHRGRPLKVSGRRGHRLEYSSKRDSGLHGRMLEEAAPRSLRATPPMNTRKSGFPLRRLPESATFSPKSRGHGPGGAPAPLR